MNEDIIKKLTAKDLEYLGVLAQKWEDECPPYWVAIHRFSILERLNRKTYNTEALDFTDLSPEELDNALVASLACEDTFDLPDTQRLARFFACTTDKIEREIFAR